MMKGLVALSVLALGGCASYHEDIATQPSYSVLYRKYDCDSLLQEEARVATHMGQLSAAVDANATGDIVKTAVGLAVFPPLLMFLEGHSGIESEYAQLKGQQQAIQIAAIQKKCYNPPAVSQARESGTPPEETATVLE
jgi:hypothetical protein